MQFRDLQIQYEQLKGDIDQTVLNVLSSGQFIGGNPVDELESQLAEYVGVKHCITCANGTDALSLVLMAWGIGEGDAVFVPDFTFFATGEVVSYQGATPIFVDVDERTYNLDPTKLEKAIEKVKCDGKLTPKVIISVDLFGLPANYKALEQIADQHSLLILEDSAQGFGGSIDGQMAGSFGHAATTSFFPAKPLGCYGDGGAIFTNDDTLANLLSSIKVHGKGENKYDNVRIGMNSRLDTIQASILKVKLQAFREYELERVNKIYDLYTTRLKTFVKTPYIPKGYYSSFAQYTIQLNSKEHRDSLQTFLKECHIPTMVYYVKPMHRQSAFNFLPSNEEDFQVTNRLVDTVLSLPMHPYIKEVDVEKVCNQIQVFMKLVGERK